MPVTATVRLHVRLRWTAASCVTSESARPRARVCLVYVLYVQVRLCRLCNKSPCMQLPFHYCVCIRYQYPSIAAQRTSSVRAAERRMQDIFPFSGHSPSENHHRGHPPLYLTITISRNRHLTVITLTFILNSHHYCTLYP